MQEKQRISTHRLCMDAMLAALCAVLGYVSLDLGNMKITFESLPILLGALMFGPLDGFAAGAMGTLIYQLLRYGVSVTTLLWILPYALAGLAAGWYAKRRGFVLRGTETLVLVMACELLITLLNTGMMYVDSKIYGYYSFAYIFGSFAMRLVLCLAKGAAFGAVLPRLVRALQALRRRAAV
ncbi:MAG: ECF transporter S component [Oscillospiraceae bacterium]|nr:ECF transporter S component [Oscillospiraceae bacterium]